ncbi:hypothetical protein [Tautonia marina]|uniref:hypothetical protein n=1 Tax=Tautonia marina TaxID=2653855 RepID=UPI001260AF6E|nr:hypothetical protein [Tautonia marina]
MAATLSQILANRLNALRSTGPKTEAGKAASRRNAQTHGLSRVGTCPPENMAATIAERQQLWSPDYRPDGPAQRWHFDRLVAESVRLDACEARIVAARAELATTASESWDDDRAAEAASLGYRLASHPDRIQLLLLQSRHGVLWLLERWDEVADSLHRHEGWTRDTWNLALDLLGVSPFARDGTGPWDLDPEDKTASPGLDLVSQAVLALRDRLDAYLDARDARHRLDAEAGLHATDPAPIRLLERYAADARRQITRSINELRRLQSLGNRSTTAPTPEVESHSPGPRPDRSVTRCRPDVYPTSNPSDPNASACSTAPTASSSPARNEPMPSRAPSPAGSLRSVLRTPLPPSNRRARRAQAATARRRS